MKIKLNIFLICLCLCIATLPLNLTLLYGFSVSNIFAICGAFFGGLYIRDKLIVKVSSNKVVEYFLKYIPYFFVILIFLVHYLINNIF